MSSLYQLLKKWHKMRKSVYNFQASSSTSQRSGLSSTSHLHNHFPPSFMPDPESNFLKPLLPHHFLSNSLHFHSPNPSRRILIPPLFTHLPLLIKHFLDASSHLYNRLCPSGGWSVGRLVTHSLKTSKSCIFTTEKWASPNKSSTH